MHTISTIVASFFLLTLASSVVAQLQEPNRKPLREETHLGLSVIKDLDISALESSKIHRFYFRASELNSGAPVYIPLWVARGLGSTKDGKTMFLSAVVHGDELNGIRVLHKVLADLNPPKIKGTVIGVPGVNVIGMAQNNRFIPEYSSAQSYQQVDLNRAFPGKAIENGGGLTDQLAYNFWNGLTKNGTQVDVAIDIHTQSTGENCGLGVYSDWRVAGARKLSELIGADIIKIDPGEHGCLETTFMEHGVPAITLEIGSAKRWQNDLIDRSHNFILRALNEWDIRTYDVPPSPDPKITFAADSFSRSLALTGGFFMPNVTLLQDVQEGQLLGIMYDSFGDEIQKYNAKVSGRVEGIAYDPAREPGARLVTLSYNSTQTSRATAEMRRREH